MSPTPGPAPASSVIGCWTVLEYAEVSSTNWVAARLPAWHAVRADRQTSGRGRFQRTWVSDEGGLWLSAVVPAESEAGRLLPLIAGLAVAEALQSFGIKELRLRWPNDVMIGTRKLAGLLVDQFVPGLAVVGMGINFQNQPEARDPALIGHVTRVSDWLSPVPKMTQVLERILNSLSSVIGLMAAPEAYLPRINALWRTAVPVEVDLDGLVVTGRFMGIDESGRLKLLLPAGETRLLEPHEVRLFREIL